jgi:hypothetical protein
MVKRTSSRRNMGDCGTALKDGRRWVGIGDEFGDGLSLSAKEERLLLATAYSACAHSMSWWSWLARHRDCSSHRYGIVLRMVTRRAEPITGAQLPAADASVEAVPMPVPAPALPPPLPALPTLPALPAVPAVLIPPQDVPWATGSACTAAAVGAAGGVSGSDSRTAAVAGDAGSVMQPVLSP